jgi:antitoxin (DNA-binding transcriptional repressor) of toxin-antitoxin stability system
VKKATLEKVQARLSEYVASSVKNPVLILDDGEPVAMLVGLARKANGKPVKLRDVLKRAWKDYEKHGGIPHEDFWKDMAEEMGSL